MTLAHTSCRRSEQGFTLVELAIVMVIIGLLIGGILKGQELINNARTTSTIGQVNGMNAAMNSFFDKYNQLAGDMNNVQTRLPGGVAADNGDGNGRINEGPGAAATLASEGVRALRQLSRADLISGIDTSRADVASNVVPVKSGGLMWLGQQPAAGGAVAGLNALQANAVFAVLNGNTAAAAAGTGSLPVVAAAQIDRKVDDGVPTTGNAQASCGQGGVANGAYAENVTNVSCAMFARVR